MEKNKNESVAIFKFSFKLMLIVSVLALMIVGLTVLLGSENNRELIHVFTLFCIVLVIVIPSLLFLITKLIYCHYEYRIRRPLTQEGIERRNKWLVAILSLMLLLMAFVTQGQTNLSRIPNYDYTVHKRITTIFPSEPMVFVKNKKDTVFLSIRADSVGGGIYGITLYSYLPVNYYHKKLHLVFENGATEEFLPIALDENDINTGGYTDVYTKYQIRGSALKTLITQRCKKVIFDGATECIIREEKNYFKDFLVCYYK